MYGHRPVLAIIASLTLLAAPLPVTVTPAAAATSPFTDIADSLFRADIEWLWAEGITRGCTTTTYCPDDRVTRDQMASFLARMFKLPPTGEDFFTDDTGNIHEQNINRLAAAGIATGCTETTYCPKDPVQRGQMASFLARAIPLTEGTGRNYFRDDDGTLHEANIDRLAAAGIGSGCGIWRYCPSATVTRGQMAAFLHRVVKPLTSVLPYPAPGISTLYVATTGTDGGNGCLVKASPCRTLRYALGIALDGDTISIGPGTYAEENLSLAVDLTITGDPGGGTTIDASGGGRYRVLTIPAGRTVTLAHLTLTGGRADNGGAISSAGTLTITDSTIRGNTASGNGGGIVNLGDLTISASTISGNVAGAGGYWGYGGGIESFEGSLTITGSTISGNTATYGGGVRSYKGTLTITASTVSGNTGVNSGGGIASIDSTTSVTDSTISGNAGGGVSGYYSTLAIVDSTISGHTDSSGITVYDTTLTLVDSTVSGNTAARGGGIEVAVSVLTLVNSTVSGNAATEYGGGVSSEVSTVTVVHSTISGNTAELAGGGIWLYRGSAIDLANSLVAGNTSPPGPDVHVEDGGIPSQLASIVGIPAGLTLADILDPAGLKDNGGPTETIALVDSATNPAIGAGDAATCAASPVNGLDQRGEPRTPPCDIGAYELQP